MSYTIQYMRIEIMHDFSDMFLYCIYGNSKITEYF